MRDFFGVNSFPLLFRQQVTIHNNLNNMKMKNLILMAAIAMMPLVACNANGGSTNATEQAAPAAAPAQKPDLGFLTAMGLDVSNLTIIDDVWEFSVDFIELNEDQALKLLPMAQYLYDGDIYDGRYYIAAAKALPDGYTMLLYGWETGDDASLEMMGVYDKDGKITDFMQLGNMGEFCDIEQNDEYTQGRAQMTNIDLKFTAPGVFTLDKTVKEADWQQDPNNDDGNRQATVQTLETYSIDGKGHIALDGRKEVKRQGTPNKEYEQCTTINDLSRLPMSDATRIDQLTDLAGKMKQMLGDQQYADGAAYNIISAIGEYFATNPDALFQWIYKNRDRSNMIVSHLQKGITNSLLDKALLDKAINQMTDRAAQKYIKGLTAGWEPE